MTEPALEADGRCSACRGRLCEYHQLEGVRRDRAQSAMLREVAATIRFRNLPDDGCDLNHNEDNPRTHR